MYKTHDHSHNYLTNCCYCAVCYFISTKGDNKQLEKELEDVAAQWMQENFELKQRISELEKAMKMDSPSIEAEQVPDSPKVRELMKNK